MKICSLLASGENGGKIWNLFKPAVVTSSRQVYQRMKVSQLVAYICRMRPHYRKYIFVDRPRRTFFLLFKHLPNRVLHDVPWILFLLLLLLFYWTTTRLYRNTNPLIRASTIIQLGFTSSSIFLISRRSLFAIISVI